MKSLTTLILLSIGIMGMGQKDSTFIQGGKISASIGYATEDYKSSIFITLDKDSIITIAGDTIAVIKMLFKRIDEAWDEYTKMAILWNCTKDIIANLDGIFDNKKSAKLAAANKRYRMMLKKYKYIK